MPHSAERIVLVTGGSRGVGAKVARQLAGPDTHVVVHYRARAQRAEMIAQAIRDAGGHASTLAADLSVEADTAALIDTVRARFGRLDTLILNASGGLENGADPGYAMRLNRDAQKRLALLAIPLMPVGGRVVFVTSHQAHFFPNKAVPKGYTAVAASKRAGETALYAMRSHFDRAGVRFTVVSGDMIDGTITVRLLHRPTEGEMPTVGELAVAIVNAATVPNPASIAYVGGADSALSVGTADYVLSA